MKEFAKNSVVLERSRALREGCSIQIADQSQSDLECDLERLCSVHF